MSDAKEKLEVAFMNYCCNLLRLAGLNPSPEQYEAWREEARGLVAEVERAAAVRALEDAADAIYHKQHPESVRLMLGARAAEIREGERWNHKRSV